MRARARLYLIWFPRTLPVSQSSQVLTHRDTQRVGMCIHRDYGEPTPIHVRCRIRAMISNWP